MDLAQEALQFLDKHGYTIEVALRTYAAKLQSTFDGGRNPHALELERIAVLLATLCNRIDIQ